MQDAYNDTQDQIQIVSDRDEYEEEDIENIGN